MIEHIWIKNVQKLELANADHILLVYPKGLLHHAWQFWWASVEACAEVGPQTGSHSRKELAGCLPWEGSGADQTSTSSGRSEFHAHHTQQLWSGRHSPWAPNQWDSTCTCSPCNRWSILRSSPRREGCRSTGEISSLQTCPRVGIHTCWRLSWSLPHWSPRWVLWKSSWDLPWTKLHRPFHDESATPHGSVLMSSRCNRKPSSAGLNHRPGHLVYKTPRIKNWYLQNTIFRKFKLSKNIKKYSLLLFNDIPGPIRW